MSEEKYFQEEKYREFFNDKFALLCIAMGYFDMENKAMESKTIVSATKYRSEGFRLLAESINDLRGFLTDKDDKKIAEMVNETFYPKSKEFVLPISINQVISHKILDEE